MSQKRAWVAVVGVYFTVFCMTQGAGCANNKTASDFIDDVEVISSASGVITGGIAGTVGAGGMAGVGGQGGTGGTKNPCPNGILEGKEECDDDNNVSGDGCSPSCEEETCYDCSLDENKCTPTQEVRSCGKDLFCDIDGQCVDHCSDKKWEPNKGEKEIDCGGLCGECVGSYCNEVLKCASKFFCVEGICCVSECGDTCRSCVLPGKLGSCEIVPGGMDDHVSNVPCKGDYACNAQGVCVNLKETGDDCSNDVECASGACNFAGGGTGKCKQINGTPCSSDGVCDSGHCTGNLCQSN